MTAQAAPSLRKKRAYRSAGRRRALQAWSLNEALRRRAAARRRQTLISLLAIAMGVGLGVAFITAGGLA